MWQRVRLTVLAGALAAAALPAHAQERSLDIREMNARIIVTRAGNVSVTERFVVHFNGSWNGIYRMIPVEYDAPGGLNYTLRLRIESVTDDAGTELRHEVERVGDSRRIRMWVPGAHDATRTVILTYSADNALRFFDEHDELYWNVTGAEWDFPIQSVTAEVILPDDVTGIRTTSFTGAHGSTENAVVEQNGSVITFRGTRPLGYREDLTLVVGWNPGVVTRPTTTDRATSLLASNSVLFAPVIAFLAMFALWRQTSSRPITPAAMAMGPPPQISNW